MAHQFFFFFPDCLSFSFSSSLSNINLRIMCHFSMMCLTCVKIVLSSRVYYCHVCSENYSGPYWTLVESNAGNVLFNLIITTFSP